MRIVDANGRFYTADVAERGRDDWRGSMVVATKPATKQTKGP